MALTSRFSNLAEEQKRQLEDKLKHMNAQLIEINERISELTFQRDRLECSMRYIGRELHSLKASEIKREHASGKRTV
jgi:hypothetical protein